MALKTFFAKMIGRKISKELELTEGPVDEKKKWYKSKTVWSDILTAFVGVWAVVQPVLVNYGVTLPDIPPIALTVLGAMGIHGRITAEKKIG